MYSVVIALRGEIGSHDFVNDPSFRCVICHCQFGDMICGLGSNMIVSFDHLSPFSTGMTIPSRLLLMGRFTTHVDQSLLGY